MKTPTVTDTFLMLSKREIMPTATKRLLLKETAEKHVQPNSIKINIDPFLKTCVPRGHHMEYAWDPHCPQCGIQDLRMVASQNCLSFQDQFDPSLHR